MNLRKSKSIAQEGGASRHRFSTEVTDWSVWRRCWGYPWIIHSMANKSKGPNSVDPVGHPVWLVALLGVLAAVAFVAHDRLLSFEQFYGLFGNGIDASVYRYGGRTVLSAEPLYTFMLEDSLPFTYPPFAALIFAPLAYLSVVGAQTLVTVLNLGLLYMAVHLSWRQLGYENTTRLRLLSMFLAIAFTWLEPVRMTIWLGQINLLLLVLVLWDIGRPEGSRLRGFGVGIAAGLKLTPALFIVLLAVVRDTRALICASMTFVATVIVGFVVIPGDSWTYWTETIVRSDRIGLISSPANQSIRGILARVLHTENPSMVLWIACAGVVAVAGLWAAYMAHERGERLLAMTICGLTAPMISPFSWGHHWVWTVPLIVLSLHYAARVRRWWSAVLPVMLILPLLAWYKSYPDGTVAIGIFMTPGSPVVRFLAQTAYPILYLLLLAIAAVRLVRRPVSSPISRNSK